MINTKIDKYELSAILSDMVRTPSVGDITATDRAWLQRFTDSCRWRLLDHDDRAQFVDFIQTQLGGRDGDRVSSFLEDLFCAVGLTTDACWEAFEELLDF